MEILTPALRDAAGRPLSQALASADAAVVGRRLETSGRRADGTEFPLEVAITPLQPASRRLFIAYLRDITHLTPLCYDEFGAVIESTGLRVERIDRVYHDPLHRLLLRRFAFGWLFRLLGIDYARQIVVSARRPVEDDTAT